MLVSTKHRALVLRLRDPERVTAVIPKAKRFTYNGKEFLAVKHGVDEVKVLANLGFSAPSPIEFYYKWPGRYQPYKHQKQIASFLTSNRRAFNLSDLGTGKSLATLWAYDYMRSVGAVRRALVVSPLSTLERTWGDELFNHFPHLNFSVLHGTREKRLKLLENRDVDVYIINHDGIKVSGFAEAMKSRADIDLIIVDEIAQVGRTSGTDRFKVLTQVINKQVPRMCWGLTGTPIPNAPTDAWAQCRLLVPDRVTPYFTKFKDMVMRQVSTFTWVPKPNALEIVQDTMQPAIRFHRDECIDLPPCVYETRQVEMTPAQKKAYKDMLDKLVAEIGDGKISAVNDGVKAQKLLQICSGVAYDKDGNEVEIGAEPRIQEVHQVIQDAAAKVIVFVPFVGALHLVARRLRELGHTVECIHGEVSKHARDEIFSAFMHDKHPNVLVAQPAAMSHGLTLTAANVIVWYTAYPSNDVYEQACARITRPGQTKTQLILHLESTDIERRYFKRLKEKQKTQGTLLDMIRDVREEGLTQEIN